MRFDVITIFPDMITSAFKEGVIARANASGIITINVHNLRDWTHDKHKTVDDRPFSGGPGMVVKIEPIYRAVNALKSQITNHKSQINSTLPARAVPRRRNFQIPNSKVVLTSARGKKLTQQKAQEYSKLDQLIIICGRYEGVDERVAKYIADESISLGNFVLSGGELAALTIIDATARLVPGVLGNQESPENALFPQYTRPEVFTTKEGKKLKAPKVLLTGNHKKIEEWKRKTSK